MKKAASQEEYDVSVNDNEYYMGTAAAFLDSANVRQIQRPAHGMVVFRSSSGKHFDMPLANFYWGVILFNGRTKPIEADLTDLKNSYQAYMRK